VKLKPFIQRVDGSAKGDWDVGIALDAIEYAKDADVVVLASGDGDFDYGKELPPPIHHLPTIDEFSLHFRVHPSSVRKLVSYNLIGLVEKKGETRVILYPQRIITSGRNGLIID